MIGIESEVQRRQLHQLSELQQEISELRKSKAKLRHNFTIQKAELQNYKILLEHLPQGIFYKHCNGFYISCNRSYALRLRISPGEIGEKSDYDFYPSDMAKKLCDADRQVVETCRAVHHEYTFPENGTDKVISFIKIPIMGEHDEITGILGISTDITAQKRAEEELRKNEEAFRLAFENAKDAIVWIDVKNGSILRCNRSAEILLETEQHELEGAHFATLYPPHCADECLKWFSRQVEENSTLDAETEVITKSGKIVPVHLTASISCVGDIMINQGIFRNISDRKGLESDIRHRDSIADAVHFAAERFLNADSWELAVRDVMERLGNAVDASRVYLFKKETEKDGSPVATDWYEWVAPGISLLCRDPRFHRLAWRRYGLTRWEDILTSNRPLQGIVRELPAIEREFLLKQDVKAFLLVPVFVNDEPWGSIGFDDCSREREWSPAEINSLVAAASVLGVAIGKGQAIKKIQESESRFRSITQSANEAIVCIDSEGNIVFWNDAAERMFGYCAGEMMSRPVTTIVPCAMREYFFEKKLRAILQGDDDSLVKQEEMNLMKNGGDLLPVELTLSAWQAREGQFYSLIIRDISERKQAEEKLRRVREEFFTTLTHDMKGPLTAAMGCLYLLKKPQLGPISEKKLECTAMIKHNMELMLSMIENILDSSKLEDDRIQCRFEHFSLNDMVDELRHIFDAVAMLCNISIAFTCPADTWVHGDRKMLLRVFFNLINNAARHTPPGGRINLEVTAAQERLKVSVSDTGCGIPAAYQEIIFQKYGKVEGQSGGTGLGLYIVKSFLHEHGSEIHVESAPDKGTTFTFELPRGMAQ